MLVSKQAKSSIKDGIAQKLVSKTKGPYIVLEKDTPISYWIQYLSLCEGIGRPGRKVKKSAARMENTPSTVVLHKYLDRSDTRFSTIKGPLLNNLLGKWLGVIRRGTYQAAYEDSRWAYEPVSGLWPYIDPDSDSSDYGSSYEGSKYQ